MTYNLHVAELTAEIAEIIAPIINNHIQHSGFTTPEAIATMSLTIGQCIIIETIRTAPRHTRRALLRLVIRQLKSSI